MPASPAARFATTSSRQGAAAIIELHGELDLAVEAQLVAEFRRQLASDPAVVVIDLRDLSFMDAHGLRALIGMHASCDQRVRRFLLVRGQRNVHRMLVLCNVVHAFEFVDSATQALEPIDATHGSPVQPETGLRGRRALESADPRPLTVDASEDAAGREYHRDRAALVRHVIRRAARTSSRLG